MPLLNLKNAIHRALETQTIEQIPRPYLGMSGIGNPCLRAQWFGFRWASPNEFIVPRVQRIFERGDLEEERIIRDLRKVGVDVYMLKDGEKLYPKGIREEYQEQVVHFTGHSKGHIDGRAINLPGSKKTEHLCEFKTMKNSKFEDYTKNGFTNFPTYLFQKHMYMGYLNLKRCLYVVTNKDTEERSYERYNFDINIFDEGKERILKIIGTDEPPVRISDKPDYYLCHFCRHKDLCFGLAKPVQNCRTCEYGEIHDRGRWKCALYPKAEEIPLHVQRVGCIQYGSLL